MQKVIQTRLESSFEKRKGNRLPSAPLEMEITLEPSMSFYPDFIQILSRFYPDFTQILSRFYKTTRIKPGRNELLSKIWIKSK